MVELKHEHKNVSEATLAGVSHVFKYIYIYIHIHTHTYICMDGSSFVDLACINVCMRVVHIYTVINYHIYTHDMQPHAIFFFVTCVSMYICICTYLTYLPGYASHVSLSLISHSLP